MTKQLKEIEIPFGAKDSELCGWEYTIPEGMEATIVDNKIVVKKKESEDERIRKWLIELVEEIRKANPTNADHNGMCSEAHAWLEKQGEQELVLGNALKEAFDKSKKDYSLEEKKEASDYSESIIPTPIAYGESEGEYMLHKIIEAAFIAGQNTKQKSIWSEEDENVVEDIKEAVDDYCAEGYAEELYDWLESLKDRVHPQNTWKPSDEQIHYLSWIANIKLGDSVVEQEVSKHLNELLEDLKKLRSE